MKQSTGNPKGKVVKELIYGFEGNVIINFEDDTYLLLQANVDYGGYPEISEQSIDWSKTSFVYKDLVEAGIISEQELKKIQEREKKSNEEFQRQQYLRLKAKFES